MSRLKGTILVVDDEQVMREILEALLKQAGYAVRIAETGEHGVRIADREPVDLAIVDVMLPDISGLKVLRPHPGDRPGDLRGDADRVRFGGHRGHRDQVRRVRLPDQALQERRSAQPGPERRPPAPAGAGEPQPPRTTGAPGQIRRTGGEVAPDAGGVRADRAGGGFAVECAGNRRERHREGTGGEGDPPPQPPPQAALRHRPLGQPPAGTPREQPVRPCERRLHRRDLPEERAVRNRRRRQHLLRRDRDGAPGNPGEVAPGDPGEGVS